MKMPVRRIPPLNAALWCATAFWLSCATSNAFPPNHPTRAQIFQTFIEAETRCEGQQVASFTPDDLGDAVRSEPEPLLRPELATMVRRCVKKEGSRSFASTVEYGPLPNGATLILRNGGWEYITLQFIFVLPGETHPAPDVSSWHQRAAELLNSAAQNMHAFAELTLSASNKLREHSTRPGISFKEDVVVQDGDIATIVSITEVSDVAAEARIVRLVISMGPL